ncbi:MAG: NAD(+)/NADH kinase, partial [Pseudomonadales bacterium]
MSRFRIGLVLNPLAGIGGPVGLKGSDGEDTVAKAQALGSESKVAARVIACLEQLKPDADKFLIITVAGEMGEAVCNTLGLSCEVIYEPQDKHTSAEDTRAAVRKFKAAGVDLVLFAGGDGTAR